MSRLEQIERRIAVHERKIADIDKKMAHLAGERSRRSSALIQLEVQRDKKKNVKREVL